MGGYCEITCFDCNVHIGWHSDSGPGPMYMCDDCYDEQELEDET